MQPLNYAVLINDNTLMQWQVNCLNEALAFSNGKLVCFINSTSNKLSRSNANPLLSIFKKHFVKPKSLHTENVTAHFSKIKVIDEKMFPDLTIDFLVCFCQSSGEFLKTINPRFGLWHFYNKNMYASKRATVCLQEVFHNESTSQISLLLKDVAKNKTVIFREAFFKTIHHSVTKNTDTVFTGCATWLADAINQFSKNVISIDILPAISNHEEGRNKDYSFVQIVYFLLRLQKEKIYKIFRNLFLFEKWNIGFVPATAEELLADKTLPPVEWVQAPKGTGFYADPFVIPYGSKHIVFFENLIASEKKGILSAFEKNNPSTITVALKSEVHLSYPYLINYNNSLWCIPETHQLNEVGLYRVDEKTFQLRKEKILIPDFAGIDNTLIFYNQKWWMFSTHKHLKGADTHLTIHYAGDLTGDWLPHKRNPVKIDIRSSRPGGNMFFHDNELYRPAQDSSKTYGGRIIIFKITKLTETEFEEVPVKTIEPFDKKYRDGLHTISIAGNFIVIDGKKIQFTFKKFLHLLN